MANVIIGVHGMRNKPPRETMRLWWSAAIAEGLRRNCGIDEPVFAFEPAYWADRLYLEPLHEDRSFPFDDRYDNEPYRRAGFAGLAEHEDGVRDRLRATVTEIGGNLIDDLKDFEPVRALGERVMRRTHRELAAYFAGDRIVLPDGRPLAEAARGPIEEAVRAHAGDRVMLIAHSMGSILAYEVLSKLGAEDGGPTVDAFLTIGSPLGLPEVKARLLARWAPAEGGGLRTPASVTGSWQNFADPRDRVALDAHLADDYRPNAHGVQVRDDLVANDYAAPDRMNPGVLRPNVHKSYGYLRAPEVSRAILGFVGDTQRIGGADTRM
jgi:hypothetical protein